jgi:hypothetical protein
LLQVYKSARCRPPQPGAIGLTCTIFCTNEKWEQQKSSLDFQILTAFQFSRKTLSFYYNFDN